MERARLNLASPELQSRKPSETSPSRLVARLGNFPHRRMASTASGTSRAGRRRAVHVRGVFDVPPSGSPARAAADVAADRYRAGDRARLSRRLLGSSRLEGSVLVCRVYE